MRREDVEMEKKKLTRGIVNVRKCGDEKNVCKSKQE